MYRILDFCPHSSSGPPGHLPPGGRVRRTASVCWGCGGGIGFGPMWASAPTKRGRHVLVPRIGLSPAFLIRPYLFTIHYYLLLQTPPGEGFVVLLPSVGVRWRDGDLGRCASIGPYGVIGGAVDARTCTANRLTARIPHPALRATFPPGEGFVVLLPSVGVRWYAVGLGRCASIGPYETVEARTCTANRVFARIPHSQ